MFFAIERPELDTFSSSKPGHQGGDEMEKRFLRRAQKAVYYRPIGRSDGLFGDEALPQETFA